MKKLFLNFIVIVLCLVAVLPASASVTEYTFDGVKFSLNSGYEIMTDENLTQSSSVEGLIFAAMSQDGKHQIQCRRTVTDFSSSMKSFKTLSPEHLTPVGQKLFPEGYDTAEFGQDIYLKQTTVSDGNYKTVYVTVSDGKLYTFTYFGTDPTKIGEFMGTVKLPEVKQKSNVNVLMIVILSLSIVAFLVVIILLIRSFIKDYRHRKMEQSENIVSNYIKIKRRKY